MYFDDDCELDFEEEEFNDVNSLLYDNDINDNNKDKDNVDVDNQDIDDNEDIIDKEDNDDNEVNDDNVDKEDNDDNVNNSDNDDYNRNVFIPNASSPPKPPIASSPPKTLNSLNIPKPPIVSNPPKHPIPLNTQKPPSASNAHKPSIDSNPPNHPIVLNTPKPPIVSKPPNPPFVSNKPKPVIVSNTPKTSIVSNPPKPANASNTPKPAIVSNLPKPPIVSNPPKPIVSNTPKTLNPPKPANASNTPKHPIFSNPPKPPIVSNPPKPPIVSNLPKPPIVSNLPKPPIVSNPPKPPIISIPPKPPIVSIPPKPPIVSIPPKPPIVENTPKPAIVSNPPKPANASNPTKPSNVSNPANASNPPQISSGSLKTIEIDNRYYNSVKNYISTKTLPTVYAFSSNKEDFIQEARQFKLKDGKLYFQKKEVIQDEAKQLEIARESHLVKNNPKKHRTKNQMISTIKQKYFWGGIMVDVNNIIEQCLVCNPIKAQLCQLWKFIEIGIVCENIIIVRDLNKKSHIWKSTLLEIITPQSFTELIISMFLEYGIPDAMRIVKSEIINNVFVESFISILSEELSVVIDRMKSFVNLVDDNEFFPKLPTMDVRSEVHNVKCPTNEEELNRFTFTDSAKTPLYIFCSDDWIINRSVLDTINKLIADFKTKYKDWKQRVPVISSLIQMCGINLKANERIKIEPDLSKSKEIYRKNEVDKLKTSLKAGNGKEKPKNHKIIELSSTSDSDSDSDHSIEEKMTLEDDLYLSDSSSLSSSDDCNDGNTGVNDDKSELKSSARDSAIIENLIALHRNDVTQQKLTTIIQKEICSEHNISHTESLNLVEKSSVSNNEVIMNTLNNGKPSELMSLDNANYEYLIQTYDKNKDCKPCVVVLIQYPRQFFIDAIDGKITDFIQIMSEQKQLTTIKDIEHLPIKRKAGVDMISESGLKASKKLKNLRESSVFDSALTSPAHSNLPQQTISSVSSRKRNISGVSIESKSSVKSSSTNPSKKRETTSKQDLSKSASNLSKTPKSKKQTKTSNLDSQIKANKSNDETNDNKYLNTRKSRNTNTSMNKSDDAIKNLERLLKGSELTESDDSGDSDKEQVSPIKMNTNKSNGIEARKTIRTFECEHCSFVTNEPNLLMQHKASHRQVICSECAKVFNSSNELDNHKAIDHIQDIHPYILYGCEKCPDFKCFRIFDIDSHVKDNHIKNIGENNDKFKCSLCVQVFSQNALENHLLIHRKYKCVFCPLIASKFSELDRHGRQKHNEFANLFFRCLFCDELDDSACYGTIVEHNKTCHAIEYTEAGEKCCVCDIIIESIEAHIILEHLVAHIDQDIYIYKCRHDNVRCKNHQEMTAHCQQYHGSNDIIALCEPFDSTHLFQEINKKIKNRNSNANRKIPNQTEMQNAIAALMDDSFQDNDVDEHILENNDVLGNALNMVFNDDMNNNNPTSPEQYVEYEMTDSGQYVLVDNPIQNQE